MRKLILVISTLLAAKEESSAFTTVVVKDSIATNTHWTNDQQYLLRGIVYVTAGNTLTIDSGVIIKGERSTKGALIVERGAKLFANGTRTAPIVFTSAQSPGNRAYGDWGGIIICGSAPVNWAGGTAAVGGSVRSQYGGQNVNDSSGSLQFVRVEFSGCFRRHPYPSVV